MFTMQELEIIKAFIKRATMTGDEAFEYVAICNKIQAELNGLVKKPEEVKKDGV